MHFIYKKIYLIFSFFKHINNQILSLFEGRNNNNFHSLLKLDDEIRVLHSFMTPFNILQVFNETVVSAKNNFSEKSKLCFYSVQLHTFSIIITKSDRTRAKYGLDTHKSQHTATITHLFMVFILIYTRQPPF